MSDAIEALLCIIGGALIGGAIGFCWAESRLMAALDGARDDFEKERAEHADTRAERDRWKGAANQLHDENDAHRAFFDPLFTERDN
jgi:hypothetical protein